MRLRLMAIATLTGLATVAGMTASAAPASAASPPLANAVSQTPVSWTPNVSAGPNVGQTYCNSTFFGTGALYCQSEVYDTAYVNGDVVVVGAFTEACQPGKLSSGLCTSGTQVTRDDIFAYNASTGKIDPNFWPKLNSGPAYSVVAGPNNTVYVGGAFTTVNGFAHKGLVQLQVTPSTPSTDGAVVTTFKANVSGFVHNLALSPDQTALYVGGQFTSMDSMTGLTGLARVNATTGAVDPAFTFKLSGAIQSGTSTLPMKIESMSASSSGNLLAVTYSAMQINGQNDPRLAVISTPAGPKGTLGTPASLTDFTAPILSNNCSAEHDYTRAVSMAQDGSFLVIADTGYKSGTAGATNSVGSVCDAIARFDLTAANTGTAGTPAPTSPAWINYTGGDSFYSVAVAGSVVYAGGHNRWVNNYCGTDQVCSPDALLQNGLSAFDANTGMGLAWWHPMTLRGHGTMYLHTFAPNTYDGTHPGLALGTDVDLIAGTYHSENALFPMGPVTTANPAGPIPSGMFIEDGGQGQGIPMCVAAAGSTSGSAVDIANCLNVGDQNWSVPASGKSGTISVNGLCLDSSGSSAGSPAVIGPCTGAPTQTWQQGAGNTVVQTSTGLCLTDEGASTTSPTPLYVDTCTATGVSAGNQVWPLPVAPGSPTSVPTGPLYLYKNQANTQVPCMDDTNNSTAAGNKVQIWTCRGDTAQNWALEPDGTVQLRSGYCLDSSGASAGSTVVLNPCAANTASQVWTPDATNNTLVQKSSGLCLTAASTTNGAPLTISTCTTGTGYSSTQSWWHDGIGAPTPGVPDTVRVTSPGAQATTVKTKVSLPIQASSSTKSPLTYSASGLPAGLSIDPSTGLITGAPTTAGTSSVKVTATDSTGASGSTTFGWTVTAAVVTGRIVGYRNMCVSDYLYRNASGTPVVIDPCNNLLREKWTLGPSNELTIQGMCLTDPGWGRWRTKLTLEPCHGWTSQQWRHQGNGQYVVDVHGLCLTDPNWSTAPNRQLIIQSCRDWQNQRWSQV
ncbi:MAG: ricin-type beta-trefoil lectin domain protein [Actinomycetota bacterium]|nr:ricin-type beta-trefoil lectin domain protein [Actinomycetota bacterium]